jgi:hypothetical protein
MYSMYSKFCLVCWLTQYFPCLQMMLAAGVAPAAPMSVSTPAPPAALEDPLMSSLPKLELEHVHALQVRWQQRAIHISEV